MADNQSDVLNEGESGAPVIPPPEPTETPELVANAPVPAAPAPEAPTPGAPVPGAPITEAPVPEASTSGAPAPKVPVPKTSASGAPAPETCPPATGAGDRVCADAKAASGAPQPEQPVTEQPAKEQDKQEMSRPRLVPDVSFHTGVIGDASRVGSDTVYPTGKPRRESSSKKTPDQKKERKSRGQEISQLAIKRSYASYLDRQVQKYMNTYKLESDKPFNADKVHSILVDILKTQLDENMNYDPEQCPSKAKSISTQIRSRVKEQEYDRYKLICLVTIGEKKSCDIFSCVRFLWDSERDRYATHVFENMHIYVIASVFGLFHE